MAKSNYSNEVWRIIYLIICTATAIIGNEIHGSIGWAIFDFLFTPLVWVKWLICQDVSLDIITKAFNWFLNNKEPIIKLIHNGV